LPDVIDYPVVACVANDWSQLWHGLAPIRASFSGDEGGIISASHRQRSRATAHGKRCSAQVGRSRHIADPDYHVARIAVRTLEVSASILSHQRTSWRAFLTVR
jgi:hypothetical protein